MSTTLLVIDLADNATAVTMAHTIIQNDLAIG